MLILISITIHLNNLVILFSYLVLHLMEALYTIYPVTLCGSKWNVLSTIFYYYWHNGLFLCWYLNPGTSTLYLLSVSFFGFRIRVIEKQNVLLTSIYIAFDAYEYRSILFFSNKSLSPFKPYVLLRSTHHQSSLCY